MKKLLNYLLRIIILWRKSRYFTLLAFLMLFSVVPTRVWLQLEDAKKQQSEISVLLAEFLSRQVDTHKMQPTIVEGIRIIESLKAKPIIGEQDWRNYFQQWHEMVPRNQQEGFSTKYAVGKFDGMLYGSIIVEDNHLSYHGNSNFHVTNDHIRVTLSKPDDDGVNLVIVGSKPGEGSTTSTQEVFFYNAVYTRWIDETAASTSGAAIAQKTITSEGYIVNFRLSDKLSKGVTKESLKLAVVDWRKKESFGNDNILESIMEIPPIQSNPFKMIIDLNSYEDVSAAYIAGNDVIYHNWPDIRGEVESDLTSNFGGTKVNIGLWGEALSTSSVELNYKGRVIGSLVFKRNLNTIRLNLLLNLFYEIVVLILFLTLLCVSHMRYIAIHNRNYRRNRGRVYQNGRKLVSYARKLKRECSELIDEKNRSNDKFIETKANLLSEKDDLERRMNTLKRELALALDEKEKELEKSKLDLHIALRGFNHEVGTPASNIEILVKRWREKRIFSEQFVDGIEEQSKRINCLVDAQKLMDKSYEYRENDNPLLEKSVLDLVGILKGILSIFKEKKQGKIETILNVKEEPMIVKVAQHRFPVAIDNILNNAASFANDGKVMVELLMDDEKENAIIKVSNHGSVIPLDKIESIFNFQESYRRNTEERHFGIGLYLTKRIVLDHGGSVWAENFDDYLGVSFFIAIPLSKH